MNTSQSLIKLFEHLLKKTECKKKQKVGKEKKKDVLEITTWMSYKYQGNKNNKQ